MNINFSSSDINFALKTVLIGSNLAENIRAEFSDCSLEKDDKSPVTAADFGVQAISGALISKYFPDVPLVGEEKSDVLKKSENSELLFKITENVKRFITEATEKTVCDWIDRGSGETDRVFWTIDPIDGTRGFVRGDQYALSLALIKNSEVCVGVVACPNLNISKDGKGFLTLAVKGKGCWGKSLTGKDEWARMQVSECRDIKEARIVGSFESSHTNKDKITGMMERLGIYRESILMDSQAKHVVIASGGGEIFMRIPPKTNPEYKEKIWDVAASALAIEEAGGIVTDLNGEPLNFGAGKELVNNTGLIATNEYLHEHVVKAYKEIL